MTRDEAEEALRAAERGLDRIVCKVVKGEVSGVTLIGLSMNVSSAMPT